MMKKVFVTCLLFLVITSAFATAQESNPYSMLDPKPYNPDTDPNIDLFISNWKESMPRQLHGSLVVRDIFTPCEGDPLRPVARGAVLNAIKGLSHASLDVGVSTTPATLKDEQEIFYFDSGKGTLKAGNKSSEVYEGVLVLMPPDIEFTMKNTGDEPLTMYIIFEPIPEGFEPKKEMVVSDENVIPLGGTTGHWTHITKGGFRENDGLAVLTGMCPVWYDPMTMGQPHSHGEGTEEIWFALKGDINLLLGKQMRKLPVGSAYKIPPNGKTPHSNINATDKPIKLFWLMKNVPHEVEPYANLDPKPYDPETDPNIDMFMGSYKESMAKHTHGALLERNVLTKGDGDTVNPTVKGAVLKYVNRFTHASLMDHNSTIPTTLKGEQEIFYILSGNGTITAGNKTADLYSGIAVLMPANLEFTMTNTGDEPLTMYLISEPYSEGFRLNKEMLVVDENTTPIYTSNTHWIGVAKHLFRTQDGLGTLESVQVCSFGPMTFFHPHSHVEGTEEVWTAVYDDINVLIGKQIRLQPPGTAYLVPTDGRTPHANFNVSDKPVKMFYFARYGNHEVRK